MSTNTITKTKGKLKYIFILCTEMFVIASYHNLAKLLRKSSMAIHIC